MARIRRLLGWLVFFVMTSREVPAAPPSSALSGPDFVALVPRGSLVMVGGGDVPRAARDYFVAEGKKGTGKLVVIPSASVSGPGKPRQEAALEWAGDFPEASVLDCATRQDALKPEAARVLEDAQAVWIGGGQQSRLAELYQGTPVEKALRAVLERGGVVGGTSAGAAILCKIMIASQEKNQEEPVMGVGWDLLPRVIMDQHFMARKHEARLRNAVRANPGLLGLAIDEGTALVVNQRLLAVTGTGEVRAVWSHNGKEVRDLQLKAGDAGKDDLVRLWRMAINQPPSPSGKPALENGSIVAVGGGGMVPEVVEKFMELAGGKEALIVVLPTAGEPGDSDREARQAGSFFKRAGAKNVRSLPGVKRAEVDSPEYVKVLGEAKGVWFGGGRQWRFVDAYEGTKALEAMRGVLARGGVIGGSSAGATIVGDYLCRGGPLGNREILVPGYDRGLAFLPGVGIDQHFAQRQRFADMELFIREQPAFLGVGIDEATALVVHRGGALVLGPGQVHLYRQGKPKRAFTQGEAFQLD